MKVDRTSLLVQVEASTPLGELEDGLRTEGLTLDLTTVDRHATLGAWLADGASGARDPWSDPADHLVAGLEVTLRDGNKLVIRPTPRRAVGPDLIALVVGMKERYARVDRAWLRIHTTTGERARVHPLAADRNPPLSDDEARLLDAIDRALSS